MGNGNKSNGGNTMNANAMNANKQTTAYNTMTINVHNVAEMCAQYDDVIVIANARNAQTVTVVYKNKLTGCNK